MSAAHTPHKASKGTGTKAADRWCIPLSWNCHTLQHQVGWQTFARDFLENLDPVGMAEAYWKAWKGDKGELADG